MLAQAVADICTTLRFVLPEALEHVPREDPASKWPRGWDVVCRRSQTGSM
jgi:hypothetical protein